MTTLMQASHQWATRPDDQRFASLTDLHEFCERQRSISRGKVISSRELTAIPLDNDAKALQVVSRAGVPADPTNWAFGQLCSRAGARADYLSKLPAPLTADCLNYGLKYLRDVEEIGVLVRKDDGGSSMELAAVTGPNYGRVWNSDFTRALTKRFGDGITGQFTVPGEFGKKVKVTKANTTLFASDRDMFVFLADEENRIELKGRRDGKTGSLARGFFVWNSEVGKTSWGVAMFLFDYVCCNRIVWGAEGYEEIRYAHTSGAPDRFIEEVAPVIEAYAEASDEPIKHALLAAQQKRLDDVSEFLRTRFNAGQAKAMMAVHQAEEGRPIETVWDATTAITAYAKQLPHQDTRVHFEREAGKVLDLAA